MIVRTKKNRNYTTINNTVLEDERLSWRARGIAAYLLSKPDDWRIDHTHLWKNGKEGRDAVLAAMKELEDCGYLVRTRMQGEDGKFTTFVTLVEEPTPENPQPSTENQKSVNQKSVFQDSLSVLKPSTETKITDDDNARVRGDAAVFKAWAENIPGTMTPILSERLHGLTDECGEPAVIHGIVASVEAGARSFNYIAACARNHAAGKEKPTTTVRSAPAQRSVNRGRAAAEEYMRQKGMIRERN
jgi:hypothetical protein